MLSDGIIAEKRRKVESMRLQHRHAVFMKEFMIQIIFRGLSAIFLDSALHLRYTYVPMHKKIVGLLVFFGFVFLTPVMAFATSVPSPFLYTFNVNGTVNEAFPQNVSSSPYWWVNSGGEMVVTNGIGETMQGNASVTNPWRIAYAVSNPTDTDNGLHPQNIFRLVSQSTWQNYTEQAYFKVTRNEVSSSPNKNESNGLLLFNHYVNSQNLYYAGIRVDGTYVIKKKIDSTYYTMAQTPYTSAYYNTTTGPNLIPENEWIGLRTVVTDNSNGSVTVTLYSDIGKTGTWKQVLQATDSGQYGSTKPITSAGSVGIRTDFMDVQFQNFEVTGK